MSQEIHVQPFRMYEIYLASDQESPFNKLLCILACVHLFSRAALQFDLSLSEVPTFKGRVSGHILPRAFHIWEKSPMNFNPKAVAIGQRVLCGGSRSVHFRMLCGHAGSIASRTIVLL